MRNPFKKGSKPYLFYELAKPDEEGFSREVSIDEFVKEYSGLTFGNGGDWCRSDGSLGKKFNVERIKDGKSIVAVRLHGFNTKSQIQKQIKRTIVEEISKHRCAVLYIGQVEVDHKDGHRDDFENLKPENQRLEDFQPLSKAANNAKKEHCKQCRNSKRRFDAKNLGYSVSVYSGTLDYRNTCVGCYWNDPLKFNQKVSVGFKNISDT